MPEPSPHPSHFQLSHRRIMKTLYFLRAWCAALLVAFAFAPCASAAPSLSDRELDAIGRRIWQNECGGRRDGLTSWNSGEQFASLGIGHFLWYPRGAAGPFDAAFPRLARYLADNGAAVPEWVLDQPCPWSSRAEFLAEFRSPRMNELRDLLAGTVRLQSRFIVQRMEESLPKMLEAAPPAQRSNVRAQFQRMLGSGAGTFALIDYVNFKGEGIKETERYKGEGWGLLQVLAGMRGSGPGAVNEFAARAAAVLTRRVANAPPARGEARWLTGWKKRVRGYVR
ncbi:MAG TPA: hypothetical protein VK689_02125 [Armatimonadota bacterium]|nr:hypothetical protein [Armatimonadota bacterium]